MFEAYPTQRPASPRCRSRPKERSCSRLLTQLKHIACCCTSRRRYQILTRYRYHKQKKPYSAISVHVERLTAETYEEDDVAGVPDLIEVVRLQATGPSECARALRKKLKYGSVHRQLRALTILDGVLQNGGPRIQRPMLADGPLLERLRIAAVDPISDPDVRTKCRDLFGQWVASSTHNPGLEGAKALYNQLPRKQKPQQQRREQSKVLRETEEAARRDEEEDEETPDARRHSRSQSYADEGPSSPPPVASRKNSSAMNPITLSSASTFGTGSSKKVKKDKKGKVKYFNVEKERPAILQSIAASSVASTNLNNALKLINRESKRVSDDPEVMKRFETCKQLRRQILRYIHLVNSEEFLGGLIHANEELVNSLMSFEILDKSVDDDSDSEMEEAAHLSRQEARREEAAVKDAERKFAELKVQSPGAGQAAPAKPPRPTNVPMPTRPPVPSADSKARAPTVPANFSDLESESEGDDSDDPFGDKNVLKTPDPNKNANGFTWKEV